MLVVNKNIERVELPGSVRVIENLAFGCCNSLKTVVIHECLTEIERSAFSNCTKLESITIPASVQEIKGFVFSECSLLKSVNISNDVTKMDGMLTFYKCTQLSEIFIHPSVTDIEFDIFDTYGENLTVYGVSGSTAHNAANEYIRLFGGSFNF